MAAGRKQQQQGVVSVSSSEPSVARRMWRVLRAVLYMLRRGVPSGRKLAMDLHLLLHRGKVAGKALGDLLTSHHGHHRDAAPFAVDGAAARSSSFSCRALDPAAAVHEPCSRRRREVEFSCSNTPTSGLLGGKRGRRNRRDGLPQYYNYDAADVARVFELLNDDGLFADADDQPAAVKTPTPAAYATPSPARLLWAFARSSPAKSPAAAASSGEVDRRADEFIRRFYEQLRAQRSAASTPDYYAAASPYVSSSRRTPRAIAAARA
ncbi:hypothetical protein PR202_gb06672 [Eleusine coracana subsp. coracana]|uniref:Avr9/Cf-9 rapidly elicited protein n=1 Tax=Eleusine coracana subsp. coracana TaxID=191504 RepID=A0AAV5EB25_ELECO|nr:hypothetical protein QOZ80_2BG0160610 [Eleusine coracana subsp. coracana]GJN19396.1 hypothetical protein PR202_gb06672 [Eleusine coracana subsp. coracana]